MKKTWKLLSLLLLIAALSLSLMACGGKTGEEGENGDGDPSDGGVQPPDAEEEENDNRVPITDLLDGIEG